MVSIAMTCCRSGSADILEKRYWDALLRFGKVCGVDVAPVILPMDTEEDYLRWAAEHFDGFLFTGGADLDPVLFGETNEHGLSDGITPVRDKLECTLGKLVADNGKPAFGICRGIQSMNVAIGGSLWQDIHSQCCLTEHLYKDEIGRPRHTVQVNGWLADILGTTEIVTNSYHHQSVKCIPAGAEMLAHTADGVIEAFALRDHPFYAGVQWHPEVEPDWISERIFVRFLLAVQNRK